MDKIIMNQLAFYGYHGLFDAEKQLGQRFFIDLELHADLTKPGLTDKMEDSIDYGRVFDVVRDVVEGEPVNLIERVAQKVADALFLSFDKVDSCMVRIVKPDPPIPGHYQSVAVEIVRGREH